MFEGRWIALLSPDAMNLCNVTRYVQATVLIGLLPESRLLLWIHLLSCIW